MPATLTGSVQIFTFKKGILSKVAHDLRLLLPAAQLHLEGPKVRGEFHPKEIRVEGAIKKGRLDPMCLSSKDKQEIHQNLCKEILQIHKHPVITLHGQYQDGFFEGFLCLRGEERRVSCRLTETGSAMEGQLEIHPSDWGIPPFKALFGAIQLQDRIEARFSFAPDSASL